MPFAHSLLIGMVAGNIAKRLTLLTAGVFGVDGPKAQLLSDEIAIATVQTIGTASSVITIDPAGAVLIAGYAGLLENEMARKLTFGRDGRPKTSEES